MVAVREARRAFRRFHASCFADERADRQIVLADVAWVCEHLETRGSTDARRAGARLRSLNEGDRTHMLEDVRRILALSPEDRLREVANVARFSVAARRR